MKSIYRQIGDFIELIDVRNKDLRVNHLLGLSITKEFIPSVANTVGTNMSNYKIIKKNQFACSIMQVRRDKKMPVALLKEFDEAIISQAYPVFQVRDEEVLSPDYLMMWFSRAEFDRHACFLAVGGVRGSLEWDDFLEMQLPVPPIEKQREIVKEYNTIVNRIKLNEQLNQKLEETAQAIFKQSFVEVESGGDQKIDLETYIEFNPKHRIKKGELVPYVEMADLLENALSLKKVVNRQFTSGSKFINNDTLLARITPCLENGKTAFVDCLNNKEVAYGSTEFIVMRAKNKVSPYWVYCLAREENFRSYAISSMIGSSGRQRVHSDYLKEYKVNKVDYDKMKLFHSHVKPCFEAIRLKTKENLYLFQMKSLILSKMTKSESLIPEQVI